MRTEFNSTEREGTIERVVFGGDGIVRASEGVVFIAGVLPGERVVYRPLPRKGSSTRGELIAVPGPSPDRITPECPLARAVRSPTGEGGLQPRCPGCVYAHVRPEVETDIKQAQMIETLCRLGRLPSDALERLAPPIAAKRFWRYRNKVVFHVARDGAEWRVGYYGHDDQTVLNVPDCLLAVEPISEVLGDLRGRPEWPHTLREGMSVTFRWTRRDGVVWWRNRSDPSTPWLTEEAGGLVLRVPADSFFQINPWMVGRLVEEVESVVRAVQPTAVVDLYCGVGLFSHVAFRAGVSKGVGVEVDARAIEAARWNAHQQGMDGYSFIGSAVEGVLGSLLSRFSPEGVLALVDPPRGGLSIAVRRMLLRWAPQNILYISCACDTLARDLATFLESGRYAVEHIRLVDLFPRTRHFETVVWLRRHPP